MSDQRSTNAEQVYAMPVDLEGWPLNRQVEAGRNVESLIRHPGFEALCDVLKLHGEGILAQLMIKKPDYEAAVYADAIGHIRGLHEIEPIALGVVENGTEAAAALRAREEN